MERVYLLLRNNQQTGPFTIGELLQQQLRPSDMIWVEGKSTAWTYLSELELIPFVKVTDATQKSQTTSADEIERKAEELRQKVLASAPRAHFPNQSAEIETYALPYKLPEDEIQFVDHRKEKRMRKNTVVGEMFLTCIVVALFMVGIYKGKSFLGVKKAVQTTEATKLNLNDEHAAHKNKAVQPVAISVIDTINTADSIKKHDSLLAIQTVRSKPVISKRTVIDSASIKSTAPIIIPPTIQDEKKAKTDNVVKVPEEMPAKKEVITSRPDSNNEVKESDKEEKRGFLRGLFKKKKKEDKSKQDGE